MADFIKIQLDNDVTVYLEAAPIDESDNLLEPVTGNRVIQKTKAFLAETFEEIKEFSSGISEAIDGMDFRPDELEVEFAVKFSADAGIIISSVGTEANITVKMKWKESKGK